MDGVYHRKTKCRQEPTRRGEAMLDLAVGFFDKLLEKFSLNKAASKIREALTAEMSNDRLPVQRRCLPKRWTIISAMKDRQKSRALRFLTPCKT
jgi:hypothetical protein